VVHAVQVSTVLGTALAMTSVRDVQDIVLNSVAIMFVFDIDEVSAVSLSPRTQPQHTPPPQ
jgi:hypothetical protein